MIAIGDHHLRQAILEAARTKPFLGICMGLQVLMEHSEENQGTQLLGLYPGGFEVNDLVADRQRDLAAGLRARLIVAHERPVQGFRSWLKLC